MKKLVIHPNNPQSRLIEHAVNTLKQDQLIIYPSDIGYEFALTLQSKMALQQLQHINQKHEHLTLLCRNLSEVASYATINNTQHRLLKKHTPSSFGFIVNANKALPKKFVHSKSKAITIKVSDNPITQALLACLDAPLLSCPLTLPNHHNVYEVGYIDDVFGKHVGALIDVGELAAHTTTIIDITNAEAAVVQQGTLEWIN